MAREVGEMVLYEWEPIVWPINRCRAIKTFSNHARIVLEYFEFFSNFI